MAKDNVEMRDYLKKDEKYNWKYLNLRIKQQRSLSEDMAHLALE